MKKAKLIKNTKKEAEIEKDSYSLKNLLLIVIVLVIVLGIFYFITDLLVEPVKQNYEDTPTTQTDLTKITLGSMLEKNQKVYYVLATKQSENDKANYMQLYNNYISKYTSVENSLRFYYVDLSDAINKAYLSDKANITNEISELKVNGDTLFKIKDGKIDSYFEGKTNIIDHLSKLKES